MNAGDIIALGSLVLATQCAVIGATWRVGNKITALAEHVANHDRWHEERLKRGADNP